MLLATADSRDGYVSVAAQVVRAYAPVGTAEFGDGGGAVMAVEAKYRLDGESRMQELHDQLANLEVTAAEIRSCKSNPGIAPHLCRTLSAR